MMPYRKIEVKLWDDEVIADLDPHTKLVWLYILTGKHTTSLPGLWIASAATIADGLRLPLHSVELSMERLEGLGRIERDQRRRILRVVNAPRHNRADNGRVVKAWWNQWDELPECALKYAHIASLRDGIGESTQDAWEGYFGKIDADQELARFGTVQNVAGTISERDRKGSPVLISGSIPDPSEPDPEVLPESAPEGVAPDVPPTQTMLSLGEQPKLDGRSKPRRKSAEIPEVRYARAFAAGQTDASGLPFAPPTEGGSAHAFRNGLRVHALNESGKPLCLEALDAWIRKKSAEYRRAKPADGEFGGFTPRKMFAWLNAGGARASPVPRGPPYTRATTAQKCPEGDENFTAGEEV